MILKVPISHAKLVASQRDGGLYEQMLKNGYVANNVLLIESKRYFALLQGQQLPSATTQAKNLMGAAGKAIMNPKPVSTEERDRRLAICHACEFLIDGKRCQKCGCHVNWKSRLEAWHCPISKW